MVYFLLVLFQSYFTFSNGIHKVCTTPMTQDTMIEYKLASPLESYFCQKIQHLWAINLIVPYKQKITAE